MGRVSESESVSRRFERLLGSIEAAKRPNPLFGADAKTAEQVVKGIVDPILCGSGMALVGLNQYRWFARELSRLLREDHDRVLALHLPALLGKWQRYGLNRSTLELLVCEVSEKLGKLQETERERLVPGPTEVRSQNAGCRSQNGGADEGDGPPAVIRARRRDMAGRRGHRPGGCPGSGHGMRDQAEAVAGGEVGVPPGQHDGYLAFALELESSIRRGTESTGQSHASRAQGTAPDSARDFSRGTKRVAMRWFERWLSGHVLWQIGQRIAEGMKAEG